MLLLYSSKIGIFDIFLKKLCEESFEDLQVNRKIQTRTVMYHKMVDLQSFCEIRKKCLF